MSLEKIQNFAAYDPSNIPVEVLRDDWRIVFAWWSTKKGGATMKYTYEQMLNLATKIARELHKKGIEFHPENYNPAGKELYNLVETRLAREGIVLKGLGGLYLTEPHAKLIWTGDKTLIIKGRNYSNKLYTPVYLCGEQVYGIITITKIKEIDKEDFRRLSKYHLISDKDRLKWWGDTNKLYAYEFEFKKFQEPQDYTHQVGPQVWMQNVEIKKMRKPFAHPLGKGRQLKIFLRNIQPHKQYIEPFAGGATLFWAKEPEEEAVLNDLDDRIVFLLKFLKDGQPEDFEELRKKNFKANPALFEKLKDSKPDSNLEKVYRLIYLSINSHGGDMEKFAWRQTAPWRTAGLVSHSEQYHDRLKNTKIMNEDFTEALKLANEDTFTYLDPPYLDEDIMDEKPEDFKKRLCEACKELKGKWMLSFSDDPLIKDLFKNFTIRRFEVERQSTSSTGEQRFSKKYELLISNFQTMIPRMIEKAINPEDIDAPYVKEQTDQALINLDKELHELFEHEGKVTEPILNAHLEVWREMTKRNIEHTITDDLTNETKFWIQEYPPTLVKMIKFKDVFKSFPDSIVLPKKIEKIFLCGGLVNRGYITDENDIDVRINSSEYDPEVERLILESITKNEIREKITFIWDEEGGIGNQILLYHPSDSGLAKDSAIQLFKPVQPLKSISDNEFITLDELIQKWAGQYMDDGIVVQPKYDGMSMMTHYSEDKTAIYTEDQLRDRTLAFDKSKAELEKNIKVKTAILVGEMVEYKPDGMQIPREDLIKEEGLTWIEKWIGAKPSGLDDEMVTFNLHDCLYINGEDISSNHYVERFKALHTAIPKELKHWKIVDSWTATTIRELGTAYNKARYYKNSEGAMFKVALSPYKTTTQRTGRTKLWAKIKNLKSIDTLAFDADPVEGAPGNYVYQCYIGPIPASDKAKYRENDIREWKGKLYLRIGKSYNVKAKLKDGDVLEVKPIRIEWQREENKEWVTWMFPKVGIPRPEKHEPDDITFTRHLASLGTAPMKETLKISMKNCPYCDDFAHCPLSHKIKIVEVQKSDDRKVMVEKLKYPITQCKLANYYKCKYVKPYYYGFEEDLEYEDNK